MQKDNKGFTVPNEVWYSEELSIKSKFAACCIIEFKTNESGIRIAGKGSTIKILNADIIQIADKQAISTAFFFGGIIELERFGFIENYSHKTEGIEFQINF